jgi:hypothetical protein
VDRALFGFDHLFMVSVPGVTGQIAPDLQQLVVGPQNVTLMAIGATQVAVLTDLELRLSYPELVPFHLKPGVAVAL